MSLLFSPLEMTGLRLRNRIIMPPMGTRMATADGWARDLHVHHYAARALGGVALVIVEATGVENRGRCHPTNLGLWNDTQAAALEKVCAAIHTAGAKAGIQLQHGGRKAFGDYGPVAPSAVAFSADFPRPRELTPAELPAVAEAFAQAAERAWQCGFDMVELHGAHGYLLHQFLSPHSNRREDDYGGSRENRLRFPLQVIQAVREALPPTFPLWVRVSGDEYLPGGYTVDDMVFYCQAFRRFGVTAVDVSSGGNSPAPPLVFPGYQVAPAARIRGEAEIPVMAVGRLGQAALAEAVLSLGLADLVGVGRPLLDNPFWPWQAARELGSEDELYAESLYLRHFKN